MYQALDRRCPCPVSSATIWPREKTSARWQMCATSSKSVETTTTASPVFERLVEQPVDFRLGADVDAGRRILGDQHLAADRQPAADDDLLLVAAGQRLDGQIGSVGPEADARADCREPCAASLRGDRRDRMLAADGGRD